MDETPVWFDMPYNKTLAKTGSKTVAIRTCGGEKKRVSVVLCVSADGQKLKPLVIFRGKRMDKSLTVPDNIITCMQENAWMSDAGMKIWRDKCFLPHIKRQRQTKTLLALDMFKPHIAEDFLQSLRQNGVSPAVILAGITSLAQPLDVCINKPFKDRLRFSWATWMASGKMEYTKGGKMRCPSKALLLKWIDRAWNSIDPALIRFAFKRCGISQQQDGEEDEMVYSSTKQNESTSIDANQDGGGSEDDERQDEDSSDDWDVDV